MDKEEIRKIYSRYAAVYDVIFSQSFLPRIRLGLEKIGIKKGDTIIEVGVGTGLSFPLYPDSCVVAGIDITRKMLIKAKDKKEKRGFDHISLFEMDAENITFADDSFDYAVVPFVVSVVPDLVLMMSEIRRVKKKNGNYCDQPFPEQELGSYEARKTLFSHVSETRVEGGGAD
ncbi:MAG: methyltransferase domain-containing protein [Syntrophobacterales bacterium]|jgi:phosphatidylethanolamine/phosphatidyl-N-methylethanolamine N-methyltransferase|nr:methyltransferase domain-containing protein [Syntrophobacterales bacterium]